MRVMELHSPVKNISRSKGQSATAAAAYRSASHLKDERTGEIHDYTKKQGVEFDAVMIPEEAPENIIDRKSLWNAAELREKHPRARTARDIEVSFPSEFSPEQRREAGFEIGKFLLARYGVGVDLCFHEPSKEGDDRNYHLHVLMATRRFEDGDWAKNKDRTLDGNYKQGKEEMFKLRQGIANSLNNIAARDDVPVYVEHLSFEKRQIDREPLIPMSKEVVQMERDGIKTDVGNLNREIKKRNAYNMEKSADLKSKNDHYGKFYQETQNRRRELLAEQEKQFGEERKESTQELAQLYQVQNNSNWFIGFWRFVSGQAQRDNEKIHELQTNLEKIHHWQQQALEFFEKDRQKRLEAVQEQEPEQTHEEVLDDKEERRIAYLERQQQRREISQDQERGFER